MQLSDDGNFMWNGTEWIPNPDAANVTPEHKAVDDVSMAEAAVPDVVTPEPVAAKAPVVMAQSPLAMEPMMTTPSTMVVGSAQHAPTGTPAINMAAAL